MKILIVNIAWIENGWTGIDNQTTSGHRYVKNGGTAHESLNFKFDGVWNTNRNIYGFCQFTNPPQIIGNDNLVVFYSNKKIVGIYSNVEHGKFKPNNMPTDFDYFNLKAKRDNSFKLENYIDFNVSRHLPIGKQRIGQIGFTYIEIEQLENILNDILTVNLELYYEIEQVKKDLGINSRNYEWDNFIKTINFTKIEKIQKQVKDENLEEGLRVFSFLADFRDNLSNTIPALSKYKKGKNSHPTQPQWSKGNGFRVGFYYGEKNYMPSTQLNVTIGANWGGGIFIKDNLNLIFGNQKILSLLKDTYKEFDFDEEKMHIGAVWFKNDINILPSEKEVLIAIKKLSEIFEMMIKAEKMEEKTKLLEYQKQIILQGPPGTGKTRLAKQMARYMIKGEIEDKIDDIPEQVKLIQFHPSYSYEDFVRGIVADSGSGSILYKTENKILADMAKKAKEALGEEYYQNSTSRERKKEILEESDKYILIIDEINRANLSSVLGELIYALEYRDEVVESMYELNKSREIILPSNLYIIGTMNTADRSIGHIDYAIRRRFTFLKVLANENKVLDNYPNGNKLFNLVNSVFNNKNYVSPEFDVDDIRIGHSYFISDGDDNIKLAMKFIYQVLPLLIEYVKDGVLINSPKFYMGDEPIYLDYISEEYNDIENTYIDENDIIDFLND